MENDAKAYHSPLGQKSTTPAAGGTDAATVQPDTSISSQAKLCCSANSLRVSYRIIANAGDEAVMTLDSSFELPHATELEFIPLTDSSCSKLFELLVATPLQTGIRAFLQRRFEELRAHPKSSAQPDRQTSFQEEESGAAVGIVMQRSPDNS